MEEYIERVDFVEGKGRKNPCSKVIIVCRFEVIFILMFLTWIGTAWLVDWNQYYLQQSKKLLLLLLINNCWFKKVVIFPDSLQLVYPKGFNVSIRTLILFKHFSCLKEYCRNFKVATRWIQLAQIISVSLIQSHRLQQFLHQAVWKDGSGYKNSNTIYKLKLNDYNWLYTDSYANLHCHIKK